MPVTNRARGIFKGARTMATPLDRAVSRALKDLADWRKWSKCVSKFEAALSLDDVIKDAVTYGYQAATVDADARKRGKQCLLKSTNKANRT
jgi:hypothetical protein